MQKDIKDVINTHPNRFGYAYLKFNSRDGDMAIYDSVKTIRLNLDKSSEVSHTLENQVVSIEVLEGTITVKTAADLSGNEDADDQDRSYSLSEKTTENCLFSLRKSYLIHAEEDSRVLIVLRNEAFARNDVD